MIGDWFFVFLTVTMALITGVTSVLSFLTTRTFGDPLGELEEYKSQELADSMSKFHMFVGVFFAIMFFFWVLGIPTWTEQHQLSPSEYTYEVQTHETVFATEYDTLTTDKATWANIADQPEKYCVYKVKSYNLIGTWPDTYIGLSLPPCENTGKYEF